MRCPMMKDVRRLALCGAPLAALLPTASLGATANDPATGQAIAQQWCASCHAVVPGAVSNEVAPSFEAVAQERDRSDEWLRTWLSVPHGEMPDLSLSRQDIDALVAYLQSLKTPPDQ